MKRALLVILLALFCGSFAVPASAQLSSSAAREPRDSRKANKRAQKAQKKYAKQQKKAEKKMLKTERKNTKYPQHSLGR
jgi:hypothetical protein